MSKPNRSIRRSINNTLLSWAALTTGTLVCLWLFTAWLQSSMQRRNEQLLQDQRRMEALIADLDGQVVALLTFVSTQDELALASFRSKADSINATLRALRRSELASNERMMVESIRGYHSNLEDRAQPVIDAVLLGETAIVRERLPAATATARVVRTHLQDLLSRRQFEVAEHARDQRYWTRLLYGGAFLALLGALATSVLFMRNLDKRFGRRLEALGEQVQRLGDGEFELEPDQDIDDEIGTVARALGSTASKLRAANLEIGAKNVQLIASEKHAAMGRMMAGLAHELNNPLASVVGYAELLDDALDSSNAEEIRSHLDTIRAEAGRARDLIRTLLASSRPSADALEDVPLGNVIADVLRLRMSDLRSAGIRVDTHLDPQAFARADLQSIRQVVTNIVSNAIDALGERGGQLRIETAVRDELAIVVIEDDGPGFADPDQAIEPFYTTKDVGEGTGLGLTLANEYVQLLGGKLTLQNKPAGGALVRIELPRARPAPASATPDVTPPPAPEKPRVVPAMNGALPLLIVDDEEPLRTLAARMLRRMNVEFVLAESADRAAEMIATQEFGGVISDMRMPGKLDGLGLFRWVEENRPALASHFAFVTGDTFDPKIVEVHERTSIPLLMKPFNLTEFAAVVEQVRGGATAALPAD